MGVKDLMSILKKKCPEQLIEVDMRELASYKIAVDVSIYLYRCVRSCGVSRWLDQFISFVCELRSYFLSSFRARSLHSERGGAASHGVFFQNKRTSSARGRSSRMHFFILTYTNDVTIRDWSVPPVPAGYG